MTQEPKRQLILFSGGLDSTFLLKQALTETDNIVLVHHVNLINRERRWNAEALACKNIVNYCRKNFRDFYYSESTVNRLDMAAVGFDAMTCAFEAGVAAINFAQMYGQIPDTVMMGHCAEDDLNPLSGPERSKYHALALEAAQFPFPNGKAVYEFPEVKTKKEIIEYLGPTLSKMCWSCRTPVSEAGQFIPCHVCHTCEILDNLD